MMGKLYDEYFVRPKTRSFLKARAFADLAVTKNALPKRRGRPRKANALTAAEKQRAYRERKANGKPQA